MKWTFTIETVTEVETTEAKGQWRIGDAIAKDLEFSTVEKMKNFAECAEQLEGRGYVKYTAGYLRRLYLTAHAFPRSERDPEISWETHFQAGTPANLKQAATALRKLKKTVTHYNMRWLMGQWRAKAAAERRDANAKAKADRDAAKKKAAAAGEAALRAKNKADKDRAKHERDEQKRLAAEAAQRAKETASPPSYNEDVPTELQDADTLKTMAIYFAVTLHAENMQREARSALNKLNQILEHLTPAQSKVIADGFTQVVALSQEIITKANRKPRFKVHEGGAA